MRALTSSEIAVIMDIAINAPSLSWRTFVRDIGDGQIVKSSSRDEAEAMEHIRKNTTIPVPQVNAVFEYSGRTYIIMRRIEGRVLGWKELSEMSPAVAEHLALQVGNFINQLRELGRQSAPTHFGRWPKGSFTSKARFPDPQPDREYETVDEFVQYWKETGKRLYALNHIDIDSIPDSLFRHDQSPTLSHGDLKPQNMIVDENWDIAGVIDWETVGWYPDFWDPLWFTRACIYIDAMQGAATALGQISDAEHEFSRLMYDIDFRLDV